MYLSRTLLDLDIRQPTMYGQFHWYVHVVVNLGQGRAHSAKINYHEPVGTCLYRVHGLQTILVIRLLTGSERVDTP